MLSCVDNKIKILLVEDSKTIIEGLEYLLKREGFNVEIVSNKINAIEAINKNAFDLFLLDVQLPDGTGFEICKYIKTISNKPIIFVSARDEEINIVYGLDIGADDYITKPFRNNELISRIKSVLRRYTSEDKNNNIINYKNLEVDLDKAKVYNNSKEIYLTSLEYKILLMFLNNVNKVITRRELLEKVWDIDGNFVNDNTLSVYIKRLRLKISDHKNNKKDLIQTVRGMGYILNR